MKKVVIGMSGGVDSSVAALLLQKQGYEVIGITFKFIDEFDASDAKRICDKLNIKHYIVDYKKQFKEQIIDKFLEDYKSGITPNPCVLCNKLFKINFLYEEMKKLGADYIATGHYAKIEDGKLFKSIDKNKDQTYFLSQVSHEQLSHLLLPLEGIEKSIVREIAKENGFFNAEKKDSLDVCFITNSFKDYIREKINNKPGKIIDIDTNKVLATHEGLSFYTIGQRKGLNIGGTSDKTFVVGKDLEKNILYICIGENNKHLISTECLIENINYLRKEKITKCTAKFRYRQSDLPVEIEWLDNNQAIVRYEEGIKAVTPGQACVFYDNEECLGGGIIKEVK